MLRPTFFGSVNRWECDENDHLNVRFFGQKMQQTLHYGLLETGIADRNTVGSVMRSVTCRHMRHQAEARIAVPITGFFGLVETATGERKVLTELRNTANDAVLCTYLLDLEFRSDLPAIACPEHAAPRGVEAQMFKYQGLSIDALREKGFVQIGQGVIQPEECDVDGFLQSYMYIGRNSDSMPNLFAHFDDTRGEGQTGGAVLEYRMSQFRSLQVNDRFVILSGVESLQEKTQQFVHISFNADTGEMVTGSEAVAISMDLVKRKSIPIPPERREKMEKLLIKNATD